MEEIDKQLALNSMEFGFKQHELGNNIEKAKENLLKMLGGQASSHS